MGSQDVMRRKPLVCLCAALVSLVVLLAAVTTSAQRSMIFATTTSTQDTGLLDVLIPQFQQQSGVAVKVIAVGTGAALRMASTGDADVVLVHAPEAEKKYVDAGDLIEGRRIMHNDYVIVGPEGDPAGVRQQKTVPEAMRAIAKRGTFISRGDDSGTHKQELALWTTAGVDVGSIRRREETGQGMGATLNIADQRDAYALTDRGTYLSLRKRLRLQIVIQGDPTLRNVYHAYVVNPQKHRRINADAARRFIAFLVSPDVQRTIGEFRQKEFGESLFVPDAVPIGKD